MTRCGVWPSFFSEGGDLVVARWPSGGARWHLFINPNCERPWILRVNCRVRREVLYCGRTFAYAARMKSSHFRLLGLVAVGALSAACADTTVGSDTVRTKGIWASFEVKSTGPSARLVAKLYVGGPNSDAIVYPLVPPDELRVSVAGGEEELLSATCAEANSFCSGGLGDISGDEVRVNFDRDSDTDSAPNSIVTMPRAFQVAIADDDVVRGEEALVLQLSGEARNLRYKLEGDCIYSKSDNLNANGTIPASAIRSPSFDADEECEVTVTLTRTVEGTIDSAFGKGGKIVAIQERKAKFISTPSTNPPPPPDAGDTDTSATTTEDSDSSSAVPDAGDGGESSSSGDDSSSGDAGTDASVATDTSEGTDTSVATDTTETTDTSAATDTSEATDTSAATDTTETTDTSAATDTSEATDTSSGDAGLSSSEPDAGGDAGSDAG
jgi:hypothetical protein